jgi:hypothetical protein
MELPDFLQGLLHHGSGILIECQGSFGHAGRRKRHHTFICEVAPAILPPSHPAGHSPGWCGISDPPRPLVAIPAFRRPPLKGDPAGKTGGVFRGGSLRLPPW